ncbi:hypothetical protein [Undibacterium umbellatum]|uniref:Uncharacterized protein n=1 Tax=Undibacterium umbellatum TaxID=2762300 RepID=A0ABR6Z8A1_9BURK|nr:hypothetical protein [Undibacterium umbellatum]MBC3908001.1 hypothetical protein [Undibacterium umbellatum]
MRMIKLMADYNCFPLWEASPGEIGNIDHDSLPISDELKNLLSLWGDEYTETLNTEDPLNSGFKNADHERNFITAGERLAGRLQKELGQNFKITTQVTPGSY